MNATSQSDRCDHGATGRPMLSVGRYFGSVTDRHEGCQCHLSQIVHPAGRSLPEHGHRSAYFCMLCEGSYAEEIDGIRIEYKPFEVGYHPAMMSHADVVGTKGASFLCLELRSPTPDIDGNDAAELPTYQSGAWSTLLIRLRLSLLTGTASDLVVDSTAAELMGGLWRTVGAFERRTPPWVGRCAELIRSEFASPLTVKDVAGRLSVHPVHLSREFRRRFGQTLGEYVHQVRVRAACAMMTDHPLLPLTTVALDVGFTDHSHFCRVFRSAIGQAPSTFRRLSLAR
jgi:AraC family transcriptional regulator